MRRHHFTHACIAALHLIRAALLIQHGLADALGEVALAAFYATLVPARRTRTRRRWQKKRVRPPGAAPFR